MKSFPHCIVTLHDWDSILAMGKRAQPFPFCVYIFRHDQSEERTMI